jgi:hypothetical protein
MAAPITHIVLTEKVYDTHFSHLDKGKFFVGTSLPDIRYLGVIDRDKTHFRDLSLESIKSEDSFLAGVKFHSYLDEVREKFVVSNDLYAEMSKSPYITQALKFLEDKLMYIKVTDWDTYTNYFREVADEVSDFDIKVTDARKWNDLLITYFSKEPTPEGVIRFVADIGRPSKMAQEINRIVSEIDTNAKILQAI